MQQRREAAFAACCKLSDAHTAPTHCHHAARLPFDGRSLSELKHKIILGSFAPLVPGAPYSGALVALVHALLSKDPDRRPTCAAILNSTEAAPWLHTIPDAVRLPLPPLDHGEARARAWSLTACAAALVGLPRLLTPCCTTAVAACMRTRRPWSWRQWRWCSWQQPAAADHLRAARHPAAAAPPAKAQL